VRHDRIEAADNYVTQRAARDRLERQLAERQMRDLQRENARLRALLKQNGIRI
jgi:hypothetical protein